MVIYKNKTRILLRKRFSLWKIKTFCSKNKLVFPIANNKNNKYNTVYLSKNAKSNSDILCYNGSIIDYKKYSNLHKENPTFHNVNNDIDNDDDFGNDYSRQIIPERKKNDDDDMNNASSFLFPHKYNKIKNDICVDKKQNIFTKKVSFQKNCSVDADELSDENERCCLYLKYSNSVNNYKKTEDEQKIISPINKHKYLGGLNYSSSSSFDNSKFLILSKFNSNRGAKHVKNAVKDMNSKFSSKENTTYPRRSSRNNIQNFNLIGINSNTNTKVNKDIHHHTNRKESLKLEIPKESNENDSIYYNYSSLKALSNRNLDYVNLRKNKKSIHEKLFQVLV